MAPPAADAFEPSSPAAITVDANDGLNENTAGTGNYRIEHDTTCPHYLSADDYPLNIRD